MGKHAYLIIAHKNDDTFYKLLSLLDDPRNDLFVHMDSKNRNYDPADTERRVVNTNVIHTGNRVNVHWGGYSLVKAELELWDTATRTGRYDYYHMISGEDLPIKTQDRIHAFFDENQGKEFVHFCQKDFEFSYRVKYYHFFHDLLRKDSRIARKLNGWIHYVQEFLDLYQNQNISFRMGSQWCSITDELARYILSRKKWIHKVFRYTVCSDELFVQTLVANSKFIDNLYLDTEANSMESNQRQIDWARSNGCNPWTYRFEDAEELKQSKVLFARKFNCGIDSEIIDYVAENLAK